MKSGYVKIGKSSHAVHTAALLNMLIRIYS